MAIRTQSVTSRNLLQGSHKMLVKLPVKDVVSWEFQAGDGSRGQSGGSCTIWVGAGGLG